MRARIPLIMIMGISLAALSGCISGHPSSDTYTDRSGKTSLIETDGEQCKRACNNTYSRCMDSTDARSNSGINGPSGVYGASGECRGDLSSCMADCK